MLKKIVIVVAVVLAAFLGFAATRPDSFTLSRSAEMMAPADVVFASVNDFHAWEAWSPWAKIDPTMKSTYSGAAAGVGAIYDWTGEDKAGTGRMTITGVKPNEEVQIKLEFIKPFAATNTITLAFAPAGPNTKVTWTMAGQSNYMAKVMGIFRDMDQMVGPDFEKGLAQMKTVAEAEAKKRAAAPPPAAEAPKPADPAAPAPAPSN